VRWTDLRQNCPSNIPAGYNPAQYNEMFSWAIPKSNAGFDVWFDNFTFDTGDLPTNTLADIVPEPTFNEMWSVARADGTFTNLRNPFYTYQGMMSAVAGFPGLATTGDPTNRRLEAAAFSPAQALCRDNFLYLSCLLARRGEHVHVPIHVGVNGHHQFLIRS